MRRRLSGLLLLLGCIAGPAAGAAGKEVVHEAVWVQVDVGQDQPIDLVSPEGKSRWELATLALGARRVRAIETSEGQPRVDRVTKLTVDSGPLLSVTYVDPAGGRGAERWLLPDRVPGELEQLRGEPIELVREQRDGSETLRIEVARAGLGWAFLPSGPREVFLQRALLLVRAEGERAYRPDKLIHRWIDPHAGVVAEVWGPVSGDGKRRLAIEGAAVVEQVLRGTTPLQVFADQLDVPSLFRLRYGYDRGDGVAISSLTPDMHANNVALVAASSWDFSANNAGNAAAEIASTKVDVDASQTCSSDQCGFTIPGTKMNREDRNFDDPDPANQGRTFTVEEREDRAGDVTLWLRAGVNNEGQPQSIFDPTSGESRFCYVGTDVGGLARTEVPLWRFSNDDGMGNFFLQNGDSWSHAPFNCEANIFPHTCPGECSDGLFTRCPVRLAPCSGLAGTQSATVINEGPVTLPSGHVFNALLVRNQIEFCIYDVDDTDCSNSLDQALTLVYLWEVPNIGTVVRLTSEQRVTDPNNVTTMKETDIKYGLFPPLSITVGSVTDTSVELSWDPGTQDRVDAYKVYWDTDSGSDSPYANNVVRDASLGTTTTIDMLTPGTPYFFTVTALSDYCDVAGCDPVTGMPTTRYESTMFPITAPADPDPLPLEVSATTTGGACIPSVEVSGLTVDKAPAGEVELCWAPASDPCLEGYQILGADSPESDLDFSVLVDDTGLTTCHVFDPGRTYLLVVAKGSGGTGPWGHFGR
jgi:hypothetical protein